MRVLLLATDKLTVASHLPVVSYVTSLDHFVSMCFLFMVLAIVKIIVIGKMLTAEDDVENAPQRRRLNTIFGAMWLCLWLGSLCWGLIALRETHRQRREASQRFAALGALLGGHSAELAATPKADTASGLGYQLLQA